MTKDAHIPLPKWSQLCQIFPFLGCIWQPFGVSILLQGLISLLGVQSILSLNIAVSQIDTSRSINTNSILYKLIQGYAHTKAEIIMFAIVMAIGISLISSLFDMLVAWSISWSFSNLNQVATPKIIRHLIYSTNQKQESTIIQRWMIIRSIAEFFHNVVANSLGAIFTLIILLVSTYQENLLAGNTLLIILSLWLLLLFVLSPIVLKKEQALAEMQEKVGRNVRSAVSLSDSLKNSHIYQRFLQKINPNVQAYSHIIKVQGWYGSFLYGTLSGIASLTPLSIVVIALLFSKEQALGIATAVTLYLFASKISSPLASLAQVMPILQGKRIDFIRFEQIYGNNSAQTIEGREVEIKDYFSLVFDQVTHQYSNGKIIEYSDLSFEKGKLICLSGKSGSGKTTLMKLLSARLPNENEVTVNGKMRLKVNDLMEDIAYLPQEPKFAELSVKENFELYSVKSLHNPFIEDAYNLIINNLTQKEHTLIESDVVGVSVGQRRALMLINVMAMNKPILMLDEPLVAIDVELRKILWEAIKEEAKTKIIIVSLHEEEYKKDCNEIIYL